MTFFVVMVITSMLVVGAAAELLPIEPHTDWPVRPAPADAPSTDTLELRTVWQLDCADEESVLIGRVVSAAPGLDGRVLLVDKQLTQILVVGPDGEIEKTVGHQGEGPGEVTGVYRALQLDDGRIGRVSGTPPPALVLGASGAIVFLDENLDPAGEWMAGGDPGNVEACALRDLRHVAGHVVVVTQRNQISPPLIRSFRELSILSPPDGLREVVARDIFEADFSKASDAIYDERNLFEPFAFGRVDIDATGRLAMAPERDRWLLAVREADGSGFLVERPWSLVDRTAGEIDVAYEELGGHRGCKALDHHPAIGRVRWRPDGRLWVEPMAVAPAPGAVACFDELDAEGTLVRRVQVVVAGAAEADRLLLMEDGRFVLLRGFARGKSDAGDEEEGTEVWLLEV